MKKITPVFGPQELFDGGPEDAVIAIKQPALSGARKEETFFFPSAHEAVVKAITSFNFNHNILNRMEYAERRIEEVPEPKRWTVEDKKAGRLPEIGAEIVWVDLGDDECSRAGVVVDTWQCFANPNLCQAIVRLNNDRGFMICEGFDEMRPIETPEEKAERLENEFYLSVKKDWSLAMSNKDESFELGVRAAYRIFNDELQPVQAKEIK